MNYFSIHQNKQAGFTLVETLIAIAIFSTTVVAVMGLLGQGVSDTNYAKRKITAEYLAQEGVEFVRNMRDTYMLYHTGGWGQFNTKIGTGTTNLCGSTNGCYFNTDSMVYNDGGQSMVNISPTVCTSARCANAPLRFNSTTGKYGYTGAISGYSRAIQILRISSDQTKVTSTVYWSIGTKNYNISFSEVLFNWVQ